MSDFGLVDWRAYSLYLRQLAADPLRQDELCGCYTCGSQRHDHFQCTREPFVAPPEPKRPTIKEAFALTDAVLQLDMKGPD